MLEYKDCIIVYIYINYIFILNYTCLALRYINSLKIHQKIPYCESVLSTVIPRILEKK